MPVAEVDTFAGIDVSAHDLSVALRRGQGHDKPAMAKFPNHPSGHKALVAYLLRGGGRARVCLGASGNYSLDLALTLQAHPQVEISVINPRRARRFAESLGERSKTDPVDARVLCEYAARMPWVRWQPPSPVALHLRALTRALRTWVLSILNRTIVRMRRQLAKPCRSWWSRRCNAIRNTWNSA